MDSHFGCYQFVKDKNFESNSQLLILFLGITFCCYQFVKDKNFESNSQPSAGISAEAVCCYQFVKDKNFESNSQHIGRYTRTPRVVISLSKIKISKAIHNQESADDICIVVVISLSKIKISKAIHNAQMPILIICFVVISLSKIKISNLLVAQALLWLRKDLITDRLWKSTNAPNAVGSTTPQSEIPKEASSPEHHSKISPQPGNALSAASRRVCFFQLKNSTDTAKSTIFVPLSDRLCYISKSSISMIVRKGRDNTGMTFR